MNPDIINKLEYMDANFAELIEAYKSLQEQTEKVAYLMTNFGVKWYEIQKILSAYSQFDEMPKNIQEGKNDKK